MSFIFEQGTGTCSNDSIDIGTVDPPGSTTFYNGTWTVKGNGNLGDGSLPTDNFHYTYLPAAGDIDMRIRVQSFTGTASHVAGLMIRSTLNSESPRHVAMIGTQPGYFDPTGEIRQIDTLVLPSPEVWLRIKKTGSEINTYSSVIASPTQEFDWDDLGAETNEAAKFGDDFYIGIAIAAGENDAVTATDFKVNGELVDPNARCTNSRECPSTSVCDDILAEEFQTKCQYNPSSFEQWAVGFVIHDATDQSQCRKAREELGFEADSIDDPLACEKFKALKCDPDSIFDEIGGLTELFDKPRTTTSVPYKDIT